MNEDTIKGKWTEMKGEIKKAWGQITDDDLTQANGNMKSIVGILEQKYGKAKEDFSAKLNEISERLHKSVKDSNESDSVKKPSKLN